MKEHFTYRKLLQVTAQTFPLAIIGKEGEDISALLAGNQQISYPVKKK
jgi:hypothetical protein